MCRTHIRQDAVEFHVDFTFWLVTSGGAEHLSPCTWDPKPALVGWWGTDINDGLAVSHV